MVLLPLFDIPSGFRLRKITEECQFRFRVFSLLLASFYYYWLFWPTQSCHVSLVLSSLWHYWLYTMDFVELRARQSFVELRAGQSFVVLWAQQSPCTWAYLRDFSIEYLLTYKKNIRKFWPNFIYAPAGNWTPELPGKRQALNPLVKLCLIKM